MPGSFDGINIWTMSPDAVPEPLWRQFSAILDLAERERAARFVFERHRRQFTAAHALKRVMLTAAAGGAVAPAAWRFETGAYGKPKLSGAAAQHFNLSHCDGAVACAVSHDTEVGVDVERLDRRAPIELAGSHFATSECAWLGQQPEALRPIGFFRLWTLRSLHQGNRTRTVAAAGRFCLPIRAAPRDPRRSGARRRRGLALRAEAYRFVKPHAGDGVAGRLDTDTRGSDDSRSRNAAVAASAIGSHGAFSRALSKSSNGPTPLPSLNVVAGRTLRSCTGSPLSPRRVFKHSPIESPSSYEQTVERYFSYGDYRRAIKEPSAGVTKSFTAAI